MSTFANGHDPKLVVSLKRVVKTLRSRPLALRGPFKIRVALASTQEGEAP